MVWLGGVSVVRDRHQSLTNQWGEIMAVRVGVWVAVLFAEKMVDRFLVVVPLAPLVV